MSAVWFEAFSHESHNKTETEPHNIVKKKLQTKNVSSQLLETEILKREKKS